LHYNSKLDKGNAIPIPHQDQKRKLPRATEQRKHKAWQGLKDTHYYKNSDKYNGCLIYDDYIVHDISDNLKNGINKPYCLVREGKWEVDLGVGK
jgi:hypothetical protein